MANPQPSAPQAPVQPPQQAPAKNTAQAQGQNAATQQATQPSPQVPGAKKVTTRTLLTNAIQSLAALKGHLDAQDVELTELRAYKKSHEKKGGK